MIRAGRWAALLLVAVAGCKSGDAAGPDFTVSPGTYGLEVGQTVQLTALNAPGKVAWSSSASSVATVQPETGFVTAVGRGSATISAVSGSHAASAEVTVTVPPTIGLSEATATLSMAFGGADPSPATVTVTNAGDGDLTGLAVQGTTYGAGEPTGWLTAALGGSTAPATLTLTAHAGSLPAGVYTATVAIAAASAVNSPQTLAVVFHIDTPPSIAVSRETVPMATIPGATIDETVDVTNGGTLPLTGLAAAVAYASGQPTGWLTATLNATSAPAVLALHAATQGLAVGNYTAQVTLSSSLEGVAARTVQVDLTVNPGPSIVFDRSTVNFQAASTTNPAAQTVQISNGGGGTLSGLGLGTIQYTAGQAGWLTATIDATTAPTTITLTVASSTLAEGSYTATLPVNSPVASNSPATLTIQLNVGPPPAISLNPQSAAFVGWRGGSSPGTLGLIVSNSGSGTLSGLSFKITDTAGAPIDWLAATWQAGNTTAPAVLLITPSPSSLLEGIHTAYVEISSTTPGVAPDTLTFQFQILSFEQNILHYFSDAGVGGSRCTNCHFSGGQNPVLAGSAQTVYNNVRPLADPGGKLLCKITSGASCPNPMEMPGSWISVIQSWIASGAPFR